LETVKITISFILLYFGCSVVFAQGYYKDIFIDNGVALAGYVTLPAIDSMKLSSEYLAAKDSVTQNRIMIGNEQDENGVLLYPDGEPRFRCIYTNGGKSGNHGASLGNEGRERIRSYFGHGGSYVGSCAGAFIVSLHYKDTGIYEKYYHIWPGRTRETDLEKTYTGHYIPVGSALLKYYNYGSDYYIANVYHNGGGYARTDIDYPPGTEILLTFDYPKLSMHNQPSCWAYKEDSTSGRLVVIGSHLEFVLTGEQLNLMEAMFLYALEGKGNELIKGKLDNGIERIMDKSTRDNDPYFTKIGDKQYHHFTIDIPEGMKQLNIIMNNDTGYHLNLYAHKGGFAYMNTASYSDTTENMHKKISIHNPKKGTWYIGVECATTVLAIQHDWGFEYTGNTEVLNGVSYNILAYWSPISSIAENRDKNSDIWLKQNYPNPFSAYTNIQYSLEKPLQIKLTIIDLQGHTIKTLENTFKNAGNYSVVWDIKDDRNKYVPSGIYFYRLETNNYMLQKTMLLNK
jgi:hypothetical protein